ncbi:MAG: lipoyl(octanoyl) transferase, partial [Eudoraea sp.]|nr:lipoyl(octanoyl) transferase [Eudoraea sp.]
MNKQVTFQELGLRDYKETWDYQENLFQQILDIKIRNRREGSLDPTPNY